MYRLRLLFSLLLVMPVCAGTAGGAPRHPNVLLIMSDDQGWGDMRSHGCEKIDTPVLDRLAADGVRFDRFYVSSVCAPTRASLLTGRYHLRTGTTWVTAGRETMRADEVTLAEALRPAGYATGIFGKWHNGAHFPHSPNGQGFDEFLGFCAGHWNNYFDTTLERNGRPERTKGYITDVLTDAALGFIQRSSSAGKPFFCYVPYNAPHGPFQVPDRFYDKYAARGLDPKTASVYGMVECVDENVGRLLRKLDELKLAEDTIVVFLTDNGPNGERYNGGMRGVKGSVHEGGVRAPLFVRWRGRLAAERTVREIAAHIDLFPTLLELCGVARPSALKLDGVSLVPLLEGKSGGWPARLIFSHQSRRGEVTPAPGAARSQQHRLVRQGGAWELFDMAADPDQKVNVTADRPEVVREMSAAYDRWYADVTAAGFERMPIPVGHPEARVVELPAPEAILEGGLRFKGGSGWANDWITGWSSTAATASWDLSVVRRGRCGVEVLYTCSAGSTGSRLRASAGGAHVEAVLAKPHDAPPLPSPDRVPRNEVYEKEWGVLNLGDLALEPGKTRLTVQAIEKAAGDVMDLKAVRLVWRD
jgi:arylsulfatase A-like enzyme